MRRLFFLLLIFVFLVFNNRVYAATNDASLTFDKTTASATVGDTVQIGILVDAGSNQITSTDTYVTYDTTYLDTQSVTAGSFFPTVGQDLTAGTVYISGMVSDPGTYKEGKGTLATISFKAKQSGTVTLHFDCSTSQSNTSKVIEKTTVNSVLDCSKVNTVTITIGASGSSTATPTSATATTPTPTSTVLGTGTTPSITPSTTLPRSGMEENYAPLGIFAGFLVIAGGSLRYILKHRMI
ncbi:hypothetical protein HGA88_06480 [Candidatus Roizmanbacteria bacterium]|nr:hypothetical protein [Candidatus Roizmanbacteria bacterium]